MAIPAANVPSEGFSMQSVSWPCLLHGYNRMESLCPYGKIERWPWRQKCRQFEDQMQGSFAGA